MSDTMIEVSADMLAQRAADAQIQRSLPERDRLAFLHSLAEHLAEKVIELTPATAPAER